MCNGPLFGKILIFTLPLMLSGILQLLFNAADVVVVGRFAGNESLAAVGSTGALTNLLVNLFIGLSVGANVLVARYYGARQEEEVSQTVHTSILISLIGGALLAVAGVILARPLLKLMDTPEDVIDLSVRYMQIYFMGMPVMLLFNFGSAILRAIGDTRRPLFYLSIAGVINVILNLVFVICFKLGVAGVAIATVISQCVSASFIISCLVKSEGCFRLCREKLHLSKDKLKRLQPLACLQEFRDRCFHFQCADPVFGKLLWICSHGRKYGRSKCGGLCLHGYELCASDGCKLYQSKSWGKTI